MNLSYLENVMKRAALPEESRVSLLTCAGNLKPAMVELLDRGVAEYRKDRYFDYNYFCERIEAECASFRSCQLIFAFLLTEHTLELYRQQGWDEYLFDRMLCDLRAKNAECEAFYGESGTFVARWLKRWFWLDRVAMERLQFEIKALGVEYRGLSAEHPAINVHIPAIGPLDHDACLRDYHRAAQFFADRFEGEIPFMCHSWLLHPEHPRFLPPSSRLLTFQADYDIISFTEDKDGKFLWRLFGVPYDGNPEHLTERNSLERAYKQRMLKGKPVGEGLGVFLYSITNPCRSV